MSLETVVEDIREEARTQAEELREETDEAIDEILSSADAEAERIVADREATVEDRIEREREQALSSATLEAKQARLSARRDMLAELHESVAARIRDLAGERREELTRELLADAVEEFPDASEIEVRGAPEDAELLEDLVSEFDRARYAGETESLGGVVVGSADSRVTVDNTFDAVLDRMWDDNLKDLSALLFDGEQ